MARKKRLKMWCDKCLKNTLHETRLDDDDKEIHVCLKCEIKPVSDPKQELKRMNRMNFAEQMWLNNRR